MSEQIILVDDESNILEAYRRTLRKKFKIKTALGAHEALEMLANEGPFAVIVSDCRMPEIDGIELLARARKAYPMMVRVMLTGNSDKETAVDAVNKSDIFKFVNKPCPPDKMEEVLNESLDRYRLLNAEKELLETTLRASITTLSDVLGLVNPELFGRSGTYKSLMLSTAERMNIGERWEIETVAMLSMLGYISLPEVVVAKVINGDPLDDDQKKKFLEHPAAAAEIVSKIPRLDAIADAIGCQHYHFDGSGHRQKKSGTDIPLAARLLKLVVDYDQLDSHKLPLSEVIERLEERPNHYDPDMLPVFIEVLKSKAEQEKIQIYVSQLEEGMIIAHDIKSDQGALIVCRGQEVNNSVIQRLLNFWKNGALPETLEVYKERAEKS